MLELHERYGDVVRLAPDELSYANEEAWREVYGYRSGRKEVGKEVVKDGVWYMGECG
jgi:hypothetical protein